MVTRILACMVGFASLAGPLPGDEHKKPTGNNEQIESPTPTSAPANPRPEPARVRMIAYVVSISPEQAEQLDSQILKTASHTKNGLRKHLSELGEVKFVGLFDHQVDLATESAFQIGASVPMPSSARTVNGKTATQVQYHDGGTLINIKKCPVNAPDHAVYLRLEVEMSAIENSKIKVSQDALAPIFCRKTHDFTGRFKTGEPEVFLSIDGNESAKGATAFVYQITVWPISDDQP